MKKIILLIFIVLSLIFATNAVIYDDFEDGTLDNTKWLNLFSNTVVNTTDTYQGTYSAQLKYNNSAAPQIRSSEVSSTIGTTGKWVLSGFYKVDTNSKQFAILLLNSSNSTRFQINSNFPNTNTWGYNNGGSWVNTGVSSNSGYADIYQDYVQIRFLIDNDNKKISLRLGNTTTDDLTNISTAGSQVIQEFQIYLENLAQARFDFIEVWNYSLYGWDSPQPTLTVDMVQNQIFDNNNISILVTSNSLYNLSYELDSGSRVSVATNTNATYMNLTSLSEGSHNITVIGTFGSVQYNVSRDFIVETDPEQYFYFETSGGSPITDFTLNGTEFTNYGFFPRSTFSNGMNTLLFEKAGYQTTTINFTITNTSRLNLTYVISPVVVNIRIYQKESLSLITGTNFTIEFVGSTGLSTITNSGTKTINTLLGIGSYSVLVTGNNYSSETKYFSYSGSESVNLSFYMVNGSNDMAGTVNINVLDQNGQPISNAIVKALQWQTNISSFVSVSEARTGENGIGTLNIILDDKIYYFTATYNNLNVRSVEQSIPVTQNGKNIILTLNLESTITSNFFLEGLIAVSNNTYIESTNSTITNFYWDYGTNGDITGCINVYRIQNGNEVLVSEDCTTANIADKTRNIVLTGSYTYIIKTEFRVNNEYYPYKSYIISPTNSIFTIFDNYGFSIFVILVFSLASVFVALQFSMIMGLLMLGLISLFSIIILPSTFIVSIALFFIFVIVNMIMGASKK